MLTNNIKLQVIETGEQIFHHRANWVTCTCIPSWYLSIIHVGNMHMHVSWHSGVHPQLIKANITKINSIYELKFV